jgi:hypothetical protein
VDVAEDLSGHPRLSWTARLYRPGDEAAIMRLFRRVFGTELDLDYWRWKFASTPLGQHVAVGVTPTGEVIGQVAGLPLKVQVDGRPVVTSCIVDVMVAPEFRKGLQKPGVFPTLLDLLITSVTGTRGTVLIYAVPIRSTFRVASRLFGWREAFPLTRVVRAAEELPTGPGRPRWRDALRPVERFGPWMDQLWAICRPALPFATTRDAAFLNWRFVDCPHVRYFPYVLWDRWRARARGVAVVRLEWQGQPIATVVDWIVPRGDERSAAALLDGVEAEVGRHPVRELVAWLPPESPEQRFFLARGYRAETTDLPLTGKLYTTDIAWEWLARHWYFTMADSDNV